MKYYLVEPEVAGGLGEHTLLSSESPRPGQPPTVLKLHYHFEGWLGDELLESTPCFIVSRALARDIAMMNFTGASFDDVLISRSREFDALHGARHLPEFVWLEVHGMPAVDDFGLTAELRLVVSERALDVLRPRISHAASLTEFRR